MKIEDLKIAPYLDDIYAMITDPNNTVTGVLAPTGTGKSIGLPYYLGVQGHRVLVSVPTVTAAISLQRIVSMIINSDPTLKGKGITVGYAAEGDKRYDSKTRIIYATSGHVRRLMIRDPSAAQVDYLVLDEVHLGLIDTTLIYELWKYYFGKRNSGPRLILTSANLDASDPSINQIFEIKVKTYPIEVKYHSRKYSPTDPDLYEATAKVLQEYLSSGILPLGHILIFVPGQGEANKLIHLIEEMVSGLPKPKEIEIYPAYSALSNEQLNKIYGEVEEKIRKIIVATNIAETSITIKDIVLVIDTLLEKIATISSSGGTRLELTTISKDSANQRKGRTGRTQPGICYRMAPLKQFETFPQIRTPEIKRVPIYDVIIELLSAKPPLDPLEIITDLAPDRLRSAMDLLRKLGAVTPTKEVTQIGKFSERLPISIRNSTALYEWIVGGGTVFPAIILISLIDSYGPSYFFVPSQSMASAEAGEKLNRTEYNKYKFSYGQKYFDRFQGRSELETYLNMWDLMMNELPDGWNSSPREIRDWAVENSINYKKLREFLKISRRVTDIINRVLPNEQIVPSPFEVTSMISGMRPYLVKVYFDRILTYRGRGGPRLEYIDSNDRRPGASPYRYYGDLPTSTFLIDPPSKLLALITFESSSSPGRIMRSISLGLDLESSRLRPARSVGLKEAAANRLSHLRLIHKSLKPKSTRHGSDQGQISFRRSMEGTVSLKQTPTSPIRPGPPERAQTEAYGLTVETESPLEEKNYTAYRDRHGFLIPTSVRDQGPTSVGDQGPTSVRDQEIPVKSISVKPVSGVRVRTLAQALPGRIFDPIQDVSIREYLETIEEGTIENLPPIPYDPKKEVKVKFAPVRVGSVNTKVLSSLYLSPDPNARNQMDQIPGLPLTLPPPLTPVQTLKSAREQYLAQYPDYESARDNLVDQILSGQIPFPFARDTLREGGEDLSTLKDRIAQNLREYIPNIVRGGKFRVGGYKTPNKLYLPPRYQGTATRVISEIDEYPSTYVFTDLYTEDERIKSRKIYEQESTWDCWSDRKCVTKIVDKYLTEEDLTSMDQADLREAIYRSHSEPGNYKITWLRGLVEVLYPDLPLPYRPTERYPEPLWWLDISSGWGDRLSAAALYGLNYMGADPNTNLQESYQQIIQDYGDPNRQEVIPSPFEELELEPESFDLILTSPPFFNLEIYTEADEQSIRKYPEFDTWMTSFLFTSLEKAWTALKVGGKMAIHMGDVKDGLINEPMNLFIEQYLPNSSWVGMIGVEGSKGYAAPVWVWRKLGPGREVNRWVSPNPGTRPSKRNLIDLYPQYKNFLTQ